MDGTKDAAGVIEGMIRQMEERLLLVIETRLERQERAVLACNKDVLTLKEAAMYAGLKEATIARYVSERKLSCSKPEGKTVYIDKGDLDEFLRQGRIMGDAEVGCLAETYCSLNRRKRAAAAVRGGSASGKKRRMGDGQA